MSVRNVLAPLVCMFSLSCASPRPFIPNTELLVPWSEQAQQKMGTPPYVARYQRGVKKLIYAAVPHVSGEDDPLYKFVDYELDYSKTQVVVLEGFERVLGFSPVKIIRDSESDKNHSEAFYTAFAAKKRGIPFIGAEPDNKFVVEKLIANGYKAEDYIFFTVVRQIGQWKREKADLSRTFELLSENLLKGKRNPAHSIRSYSSICNFSNLGTYPKWAYHLSIARLRLTLQRLTASKTQHLRKSFPA